jgi:hypothetical protein
MKREPTPMAWQVDLTIAAWLEESHEHPRPWEVAPERDDDRDDDRYDYRFFGVVQRRHPVLGTGDIVIGRFNNGGGSCWPVCTWSTRVHAAIRNYYLDFQRSTWNYKRETELQRKFGREVRFPAKYYTNRTRGLLLAPPDDLRRKPADDPAVRAWLVSYAEGRVASRVTANSPALSSQGGA